MPGQDGTERVTRVERSKRQERAQRILDTAADLLLRWGYRKTTIDDIARQAGVAKGTIYLHWKTREELFLALMMREALETFQETLERIFSDSEGVLLHNMCKHSALVVLNRPLVKALFLRDTELLGELVLQLNIHANAFYQQRFATSVHMLTIQREKGLIRADTSVHEQLYMLSAIIFGYLTVEQYLPEGYQLSAEEIAEQLAVTVQRTFAPVEPISLASLQEVTTDFKQTYGFLMEILQQQVLQQTQ